MTDSAARVRRPETSLGEAALRVVGLAVRLDGRTVLQGVTFDVRRGTTLAILGPNGAGKTILLRALLGVIPHEGTVTWREGTKVGHVPHSLFVADVPITLRDLLEIKHDIDARGPLASVGLDPGSMIEERRGTRSGGVLDVALI